MAPNAASTAADPGKQEVPEVSRKEMLVQTDKQARQLMFAGFLMSICNTMQGVMFVPAAFHVCGNDPKRAAVFLGSLQSMCALLDVFASPVAGAFSDAVGRCKVLVGLAVVAAISRIVVPLNRTYRTVAASRVLSYAASSFFSNTVSAALMDLAAGDRDTIMDYKARDASSKGWGVVVGPWLAGALVKKAEGLDFLVSGCIGALCAVWSKLNISETLAVSCRKPFKPKVKSLFAFTKLIGKTRDLNLALAMLFFVDVTMRTGAIFSMYTKARFSWNTEKTGRWLMIYGLGMAFAPTVVAKPVSKALSTRGYVYYNIFTAFIAESMLAISQKGKLFWGSLFFFCLALGKPPSAKGLVTSAAKQALPQMGQGELAGCQSSISSLSNILSPQIHARAYTYFSSDHAPFYFPSVPFAICASCEFANTALLWNMSEAVASWKKVSKKDVSGNASVP